MLGLHRPGTVYRFKAVSIHEAIEAVRQEQQTMLRALSVFSPVIEHTLSSESLLRLNLIDGVVDGKEPASMRRTGNHKQAISPTGEPATCC